MPSTPSDGGHDAHLEAAVSSAACRRLDLELGSPVDTPMGPRGPTMAVDHEPHRTHPTTERPASAELWSWLPASLPSRSVWKRGRGGPPPRSCPDRSAEPRDQPTDRAGSRGDRLAPFGSGTTGPDLQFRWPGQSTAWPLPWKSPWLMPSWMACSAMIAHSPRAGSSLHPWSGASGVTWRCGRWRGWRGAPEGANRPSRRRLMRRIPETCCSIASVRTPSTPGTWGRSSPFAGPSACDRPPASGLWLPESVLGLVVTTEAEGPRTAAGASAVAAQRRLALLAVACRGWLRSRCLRACGGSGPAACYLWPTRASAARHRARRGRST